MGHAVALGQFKVPPQRKTKGMRRREIEEEKARLYFLQVLSRSVMKASL